MRLHHHRRCSTTPSRNSRSSAAARTFSVVLFEGFGTSPLAFSLSALWLQPTAGKTHPRLSPRRTWLPGLSSTPSCATYVSIHPFALVSARHSWRSPAASAQPHLGPPPHRNHRRQQPPPSARVMLIIFPPPHPLSSFHAVRMPGSLPTSSIPGSLLIIQNNTPPNAVTSLRQSRPSPPSTTPIVTSSPGIVTRISSD